MLKFLKRKANPLVAVFEKEQTKEEEQVIIAEIHESFDSAEDRLLDEAKDLLGKLVITEVSNLEKKAERLLALGFTISKDVQDASALKVDREEKLITKVETEEFANTIQDYKLNYPLQKFLTENELIRICKKYNLVYAPVDRYTGEVPEKNIKEIENAQELREEDAYEGLSFVCLKELWYASLGGSERFSDPNALDVQGVKFKYNPTADEKSRIDHGRSLDNNRILEIIKDYGYNILYETVQMCEETEYTDDLKEGLFICAPKHDFNLDGLSLENELGYMDSKVRIVKDPIVFRYCKGGIQVISKWGIEASDETLINPVEN